MQAVTSRAIAGAASDWLRQRLPVPVHRRAVRTAKFGLGWWYRRNLSLLALLYGTDKWGAHYYTSHYQRVLAGWRRRRLNLLEIGVGGYENTSEGAGSLRMWKAYFRRARIVGIDIFDKSSLAEKRIDIRAMDQTDAPALSRLSQEYGGFDIIIDDGSHRNEHIIRTFEILFPLLREGGIYAVEDIQTSYWPSWGGGQGQPNSSMSYFQSLSDGLNHAEFALLGYQPSYTDLHITSIAFFHNLILITKGDNSEPSNVPGEVQRQASASARQSS